MFIGIITVYVEILRVMVEGCTSFMQCSLILLSPQTQGCQNTVMEFALISKNKNTASLNVLILITIMCLWFSESGRCDI